MKRDYFNSIDELPIWNWWKIAETGELYFLFKDSDSKKDASHLHEIWNNIHNEYLDEYGLTDDFKRVLKLKKKWILTQNEYIQTGERFKLTEIDIINAQIQEETQEKKTMSKDDTIIFLEEKLGREINPKELTVKKYNDYIKYYSKK